MFPTNIYSASYLFLFSCCFKENVWHNLNRFLMLEWKAYCLNFDTELMLKLKSQIMLLFYFSMLLLPPVPLFFKQADPCGCPMFSGTGPSCSHVFPQGWVFAVGGRWCVRSLPACCLLTDPDSYTVSQEFGQSRKQPYMVDGIPRVLLCRASRSFRQINHFYYIKAPRLSEEKRQWTIPDRIYCQTGLWKSLMFSN